jgi:hypothetical protein
MEEQEQAVDTRGLNHEPAAKTVADIHESRKQGIELSDAQKVWLRNNASVFAEIGQPKES